jgi:hypothetical protein
MAAIPGGVRFTGFVAPSDTADTYAVIDPIYGKGGYREVADTVERDAITTERRRIGMMVYVQDQDKIFYLKNGITNLDWIELSTAVSGTITVDHGGTGLTAVTEGHILFGNDAITLATSTNFTWDETNQQLNLPQLVLTTKTLTDITPGSLEYDGSNLFFSPTALERYQVLLARTASDPYTPTNYTVSRTFNAQDFSLEELGNVIATIIQDLQTLQLFS